MKRYVFGVGAEQDLNEIWEYIAQDSIDAADKWIAKLFAAFATLGRNPRMGHKRPDLTSSQVMFWPVGAYIIVYRVKERRVEIVAVTQGERDIPSFLHQRTQ